MTLTDSNIVVKSYGISILVNEMKYKLFVETSGTKQKLKKKGEDETDEDGGEDDGIDPTYANQLLQLMQMQLQFERQRREVHAERNRRLLGKLRDSRASEEHNLALVCLYFPRIVFFFFLSNSHVTVGRLEVLDIID